MIRRLRASIDQLGPDQHGETLATLVTDDGDTLVLPARLLPDGTRAGDVLLLTLRREPDETERRRSRIADLQKRLFGG